MTEKDVTDLFFKLIIKHQVRRQQSSGFWRLEFNYSSKTLGKCVYDREVIVLSRLYMATLPDDEVEDTLRHELSHALTPGQKHNIIWQQKAIELGAKPVSCFKGNLDFSNEAAKTLWEVGARRPRRQARPWKAICPSCKQEFIRCRLPKRSLTCAKCGKHKCGQLVWIPNQ